MDLHALEQSPREDDYLFGPGAAWFAFAMTLALMVFDYVDRQIITILGYGEGKVGTADIASTPRISSRSSGHLTTTGSRYLLR